VVLGKTVASAWAKLNQKIGNYGKNFPAREYEMHFLQWVATGLAENKSGCTEIVQTESGY
jgi:hypothetical protein